MKNPIFFATHTEASKKIKIEGAKDMFRVFVILIPLFIVGCKDVREQRKSENRSFLDSCVGSAGVFTPELCSCIYDDLHQNFNGEQTSRISTLFSGSVEEAKQSLRESGTERDAIILHRFDLVKEASQECVRRIYGH